MEWKVENALSRDVERQHLNKILKEIRTEVDAVQVEVSAPDADVKDQVGEMVENNIESGLDVSYDPENQVLNFSANNFVITLAGDVTGSGEVNALSSVTIQTEIDPAARGVEEAPTDGVPYWRLDGEWQDVGTNLPVLRVLDGQGFPARADTADWNMRQFEAESGELVITNPAGVAGNVLYGLADVVPVAGGTMKTLTFDDKGRRIEESEATTDDLPEGVINLYFTDERAQDAVGTILVDTPDIDLAYDDGVPSITATLTPAIHASLDLADSALQPGDNISELVNDVGFLESVVAGTNVTIDNTDPLNPVINATSGGGATNFIDLGDVPSSYTGFSGQAAVVNATEDGLEFAPLGGGGTVTSVDVAGGVGLDSSGGPIVGAGTITLDLDAASQASLALADSAVQPADSVTTLDMATNRLLGRTTAGTGPVEQITVGSNLTLAGGVLSASAPGTGTVTSVAIAGTDGIEVDSGSPVTTSGTIQLGLSATVLGQLADASTAVQPGDLATVATTGDYNDLINQPALLSDGDKGDITVGGTGTTLTVDNNAITDTKLRDSAALSVIGRASNTSGDPADIAAGTDGHVLRRSGTTVGFGTVATAGIANDAITNVKLANMAQGEIKGRATAGTGDPENLSLTQVLDLAGTAAQGNILYRNATAWVLLPPGTSGQFLKTQGVGANPIWDAAGGSGTVTSINLSTTGPLSITGGPITTSGVIDVSFSTSTARRALMSAGIGLQPSFRSLELLDLPITLADGTYTPTITNVTNVAASTSNGAQYARVGNTVTVSGSVDIDPTAAGATTIRISLPFASTFAANHDCAGSIASASNESGVILANVVNNIAQAQIQASNTANHAFYYHFTYRII